MRLLSHPASASFLSRFRFSDRQLRRGARSEYPGGSAEYLEQRALLTGAAVTPPAAGAAVTQLTAAQGQHLLTSRSVVASVYSVTADGAAGAGVALLQVRDSSGDRLVRVELTFAAAPPVAGVGVGTTTGDTGLPTSVLGTSTAVAAFQTPLTSAADAGPAAARLEQAAAKDGFFGKLKKDIATVNQALMMVPFYVDINAGFGVGGGVQVGGGPRGPGWLGGGAVHPYVGLQTPGASVGVAPLQTVTPGGATGGGFIAPVFVGGQGGLAGPGPATAYGEVSVGTPGPSFGVWWLW